MIRRLAVIPSDAIEDYMQAGYSSAWLEDYYNPGRFFEEVYLLSPLEKEKKEWLGMKVIPTPLEQLKRTIQDLNVHLVRAYGGNWACRAACENKVKGVPVIISVHDRRSQLLYDAIKKADYVFCVSDIVKDLVMTKFKDPSRVWVLPNRVDFQVMQPSSQGDVFKDFPYKYKVLFVGRLSPEKNLDTLIAALGLLPDEYCVIAIGQGEKRPYQELALKNKVQERCFFIDRVNHEKLSSYYTQADCLCTPSRDEGFGMVFIEALASEGIVVTSDINPMNTYIRDGENGILVKDYENPQALAEAIKRVCGDVPLRNHLKKNARNSVLCFEKASIDQLEVEYYQKVLANYAAI